MISPYERTCAFIVLLAAASIGAGCSRSAHRIEDAAAGRSLLDSSRPHATRVDAVSSPPTADANSQTPRVVSFKEGSVLAERPWFTLRVETKALAYQVFVNGGFVVMDYTGIPANDRWPVNHWLRLGVNEIAVEFFRQAGPDGGGHIFPADSKVVLKLLVRDVDAPDSAEREVTRLVFSTEGLNSGMPTTGSTVAGHFDSSRGFERVAAGDVEVNAPQIKELEDGSGLCLSQTVFMPLPFPEWAFLRSERVRFHLEQDKEELDRNYKEILGAYDVIWRALKERDIGRIMPLFEERSREMDQALYLPSGTTHERLRAALERAVTNPDVELGILHPTEKGFWPYEVSPTGQLSRIVVGDHASAVIRFETKESPGYTTGFPIAFRKERGKYIITR